MMLEECAVAAAFGMLAAAAAFLFSGCSGKSSALLAVGRLLQAASAAMLAAGFALRWRFYVQSMDAGLLASLPVSTLYESALFAVLMLLLLLLALRRQLGSGLFQAALTLLGAAVILALGFSSRISTKPVLFLPSLKSGWLAAHVSLSFVAYAMYALAAALGIRFLIQEKRRAKPSRSGLQLAKLLIFNATLIFTVGGLIFGAVWAKMSWGRFWAWDPKETWAFIAWCLYLALIHFDLRGKLSARAFAGAAAAAFLVVLFTYLGVNLLFAGLHSYASA